MGYHVFVCLFVCLFVRLFVCLNACLFVRSFLRSFAFLLACNRLCLRCTVTQCWSVEALYQLRAWCDGCPAMVTATPNPPRHKILTSQLFSKQAKSLRSDSSVFINSTRIRAQSVLCTPLALRGRPKKLLAVLCTAILQFAPRRRAFRAWPDGPSPLTR